MELTHDFTVPASVEETWRALNDIEGVAGCFPGATVTGVEGDSFEGTCKVKLGPIALVYKGAGAFAEKDESAHRLKIEAKGKDKRGNGTAGADVTASLADAGDGGTRVTVQTDLAITGKPAQFGRGVMQDVSDKLLAQFVDCLAGRLSGPGEAAETAASAEAAAQDTAEEVGDQDAGPASQPTGAAAQATTSGQQDTGPASAPPAPDPVTSAPSTPPLSSGTTSSGTLSTSASAASGSATDSSDDALDLGAALLPVLVKSYWRQALGAVAGLVALRWLVRRRRR